MLLWHQVMMYNYSTVVSINYRNCLNTFGAITSVLKKMRPILQHTSIVSDLETQRASLATYRKLSMWLCCNVYMSCDDISQLLRMLIPADLLRAGFSPDEWKKVHKSESYVNIIPSYIRLLLLTSTSILLRAKMMLKLLS